MLNFLDPQNPFYRPLWRRVLVTGICLGWGLFELVTGSPFFAILFGAAGVYCAHQFFIAFDPKDPE